MALKYENVFAKSSLSFSCLKGLRLLQINGHVSSDPDVFKYFARYGSKFCTESLQIACSGDHI